MRQTKVRAGSTEPVAVIGAGCRFAADIDSPDAFWDLLIGARDGIGDAPAGRWQPYADRGTDFASALRRATRPGGYLSSIDGFDSRFFGLTPREAELMDPQQRILLETTWEALEHAGIPPGDLAGGDAGVFVGVGSDDYGRRLLEDLPRIEAWTGIGAAMCAVANRISYALDLRGPSLAVDTACSSSLVAVHLAIQSLRTGESPVAIAAGVNLIISPGLTLTLEAAGAMAADGRCKSFAASADGYGRGEGCGVLVLKRLADARRGGDRILAIIRGSAVNQDGKTNGIMAPSQEAQRHVLERACRQAGVAPETVDYVEAHGTGTRLGDPLEASALSAIYGTGRAAGRPCMIGSVKSNIGHLEAAAGVAGVIKAILALEHAEIPPTLHCTTPNPAIEWANAGLRVVTERTPWPRGTTARRAGVSAFGYGGTIAHVVLEEAPDLADEPLPARRPGVGIRERTAGGAPMPRLFPLSAASQNALRQYAQRLADWLAARGDRAPLAQVGHTLARRRSHLQHRAAVVAADRGELLAGLRAIAEGGEGPGVTAGTVAAGQGLGLVWVFSGHGSQWAGMGRELLEAEPAFAAVIDSLQPIFRAEIGFCPRQVLMDGDLCDVARAQTMIFAMQLGLAEVWRSYGVTPDAVIGHSVGEIAAAVTSGALTRQEGARLICRRSRLLRRVAGKGAMAMAALPFAEVEERLAGGGGDLAAAICSSPVSTVIAGGVAAVDDLVERWRGSGIAIRRVNSDVAFHSAQMDPLLDELAAAASDLSPVPAGIPMYLTALTDPRATPVLDGAYWAANLRNPVRLADAVHSAAQGGYRAFVEVSAHPVVAQSVSETLAEHGFGDTFVGTSLRRNRPERATLLEGAGAVHCHGLPLDWARLQPEGDLITLPQVAWQRERHWRDAAPGGVGSERQHDVDSHTLLGSEISLAGRALHVWRTLLDYDCRPYPGNHTINGVEIVPAAVLINTFLTAASDDGPARTLAAVSLRIPLTMAERREIQVLRDERGMRVVSRACDSTSRGNGGQRGGAWLTHTTATVAEGPAAELQMSLADAAELAEPADPGLVRERLAAVGIPNVGFGWTIDELWRGDGLLRARVRAEQPAPATATWAAVLDAALSIAPAAYSDAAVLRMVAHVDEVHIAGEPPAKALIEVIAGTRDDAVDVLIAERTGRVLARLAGLRYGTLDRDPATAASPAQLLHRMVWRALKLNAEPGSGSARSIILAGPDAEAARDLRERLIGAGAICDVGPGLAGLREISARHGASADVLLLAPSPRPGTTVTDAAAYSARLLISAAQLLSSVDAAQSPRLWCVTTGGVECREESHLAQSPLWGLGRIISGEQPHIWGGVIDLPADGLGTSAATLLEILRAAPREDVIALRDGAALVAKLARPEGKPSLGPVECRPGGTYLITGGLGALGLEVARWLAERGARRIVLAGRRPFPARTAWDDHVNEGTRAQVDQIRALEALGVTVRTLCLDIADAEQAAQALSPDALGLPPIRGVVHAAGVLDSRLISDVDEESLRAVMRPKIQGAWVLHKLFPPGSLDFLVLFSSCGHLLGLPGQASYGSANAFLDALALHRRSSGHQETISFGWTSWHGKGMAVNKVVDMELSARGVTDIAAPEAFAAWDLAASYGGGYYAVLGVTGLQAGMERPPLLAELSADSYGAESGAVEVDGMSGLTGEELHKRLLAVVAAAIATEMKVSPDHVNPNRSLTEQGLDSVMTMVIRRRLEKRFGHGLPATLLWHQPTVAAIAEHLAEMLSAARPGENGGVSSAGGADRANDAEAVGRK